MFSINQKRNEKKEQGIRKEKINKIFGLPLFIEICRDLAALLQTFSAIVGPRDDDRGRGGGLEEERALGLHGPVRTARNLGGAFPWFGAKGERGE